MARNPEKLFRKLNRRPHLRKLKREQIAAIFPTGAAAEIAFIDNVPQVGASTILPMGNPTDGQNYQDCSHLPLFGPNSPNLHDILQGWTPDCYAIVCFGGMALCDPDAMRNQVRRVGNKFYSRFTYGGSDTWIEQDGMLPSGQGLRWIDDIWAPIYEKAYAYWRTRLTTKQNTYASLGWGNPAGQHGPLAAIGWSNVGYYPSASTWGLAATAILENRPCFVLTKPTVAAGVPLIASHAYNLVGVGTDGTLTAYNPHGRDGAGLDANPEDGVVTFTQAQGMTNLSYVVIGTKYNPPAAFPVVTPPRKYVFDDFIQLANHYGQATSKGEAAGDFNGDGRVDFHDYTMLANGWDPSAGELPPEPKPTEKPMQVTLKNNGVTLANHASIPFANGLAECRLTWDTEPGVTATISGSQFQRPGESAPLTGNSLTTNFTQPCTLKLTFSKAGETPIVYTVAFGNASPNPAPNPARKLVSCTVLITRTFDDGQSEVTTA